MAKPKIKHLGIVKNGKKIYYNPGLYANQMRELEGKEFEEVISEKHIKPSTETHGYYRGGIIPTALLAEKFGGWTEDDIHLYYTNKYLKTVIEKFYPDGKREELVTIRSTGELNQKEMNEYIEKVKADLALEGIEVLDPQQYYLNKYKTYVK